MSEELSETQINTLNAHRLFEPHRRATQDIIFGNPLLLDLRQDSLIEHFSETPYIYAPLRILLPFGRFLTENQANYLTGHYRTTRLTNNCRTQLLYWYLARSHATPLRPPVSHLSVFYEPDQLWFNHVASHSQQIKDRLLQGHRTFILARFALSHTSIELDFEELRLITQRFSSLPPAITTPHRIVRCIGKSYLYYWDNPRWTLTTRNEDSRLVDPESTFFLSPDSPGDTNFLNRVQEPL